MSNMTQNPYPGLKAFSPEMSKYFFGRDRQIYQLLRALRKQRFTAVLGSSGSGKSSLVMAGLIPVLNNPDYVKSERHWQHVIVRPEGDPVGNLAVGLNQTVLKNLPEKQRNYTESNLRLDINGIAKTLKHAKFNDNLLIVIDQFEELFTHKARTDEEREEVLLFNQLLLQASRQEELHIYFVITMRSEYLGRCMELPGLVELVNKSQFLLPVMTRDDYREAIEKPAELLGVKIDPFFVSTMLNDIEDREDQLPLLQHALRRSWSERSEENVKINRWGLESYTSIGTLRKALNVHAEDVFNNLPSTQHKLMANILFRRVTKQSGEGDGVRQPRKFGELVLSAMGRDERALTEEEATKIMGEVVMQFASPECAMLREPAADKMIGELPGPDAVVYINHESLIRKWRRLKQYWIREEAAEILFYRQLHKAWKPNVDPSNGKAVGKRKLLDGTFLESAVEWKENALLNKHWVADFSSEWDDILAFVQESERRRRRIFLTRRIIYAGMGVTLLCFLVLTIIARSNAAQSEAKAIELVNEANMALEVAQAAEEQAQYAEQKALMEKAQADSLLDVAQMTADSANNERDRIEELARESIEELRRDLRGSIARAEDEEERAKQLQLIAEDAKLNARKAEEDAEQEKRAAEVAEQAALELLEQTKRLRTVTEMAKYVFEENPGAGTNLNVMMVAALDLHMDTNAIVQYVLEESFMESFYDPLSSQKRYVIDPKGTRIITFEGNRVQLVDLLSEDSFAINDLPNISGVSMQGGDGVWSISANEQVVVYHSRNLSGEESIVLVSLNKAQYDWDYKTIDLEFEIKNMQELQQFTHFAETQNECYVVVQTGQYQMTVHQLNSGKEDTYNYELDGPGAFYIDQETLYFVKDGRLMEINVVLQEVNQTRKLGKNEITAIIDGFRYKGVGDSDYATNFNKEVVVPAEMVLKLLKELPFFQDYRAYSKLTEDQIRQKFDIVY